MASITIASITLPNWRGSTSGITLRIYTNADFTSASGTPHARTVLMQTRFGPVPSLVGAVYGEYACTVSSGVLTIPSVTLDSTTDSTDNPEVTYSAVIWDGTSGLSVQGFGTKSAFWLAPTPTSTTWAAIFAAEAI